MNRTKNALHALAVILAAGPLGTGCASSNGDIVSPPPQWNLTMSDEFDGDEGTAPDPALWTYDVGGDGWGNGQLEYDTDRVENVSLDGEGHLRIVAREESYMGNDYTSARIKTQGLFQQKYGRFEASMKLPAGRGLWPAFWMLGADIDEVGWPECGEIDIMEFRGQDPELVHGTLHGPGYSGAEPISGTFRLPDGQTFTDDFHIFTVEWDPGRITFSVHFEVYHAVNSSDVSARGDWVFGHDFFVLLNRAVGGGYVGPVGPNTVFPATVLVDYVRIFERAQ
ncbi:MAG: glycoside hydrolase family 16 protein [Deltaproteobacteria bacterium]|nr:glycoside hydrolase family 16 protein [Deltaproteobacteria bacterium]